MEIKAIKENYLKQKESVINSKEVNELRINFLGKKGIVNELMSKLKTLSSKEKIEFAKEVNLIKQFISEDIEQLMSDIKNRELNERLAKEAIDLTLPGRDYKSKNKHPLNLVIDEISEICIGMGYKVEEGPEVELDQFNFEMLNLPKDHPARDMQDTFYIDGRTLLRTHTSPVQARVMLKSDGKPIKIICPGKVYRRDDDPTHSHQFMQIEGLVIDKNVTLADLKGTLAYIIRSLFGVKREIRFRNSYFPFTEPSVEVDVSCFNCDSKGCSLCKQTGWIEVLGAGMVHPNVLTMAGYDTNKYQGFAFGMGVDRIAMLKYGIDDIRHLYSNDLRFLNQFGGNK